MKEESPPLWSPMDTDSRSIFKVATFEHVSLPEFLHTERKKKKSAPELFVFCFLFIYTFSSYLSTIYYSAIQTTVRCCCHHFLLFFFFILKTEKAIHSSNQSADIYRDPATDSTTKQKDNWKEKEPLLWLLLLQHQKRNHTYTKEERKVLFFPQSFLSFLYSPPQKKNLYYYNSTR